MKLIAIDLDGTLLNSKNEISPKTMETLTKLTDAGHKLVIITGRGKYGGYYVGKDLGFDRIDGLVSSSNGACVYDLGADKTIIDHSLDIDLAKRILTFGKNLKLNPLVYVDDIILAENIDAPGLSYLAEKNKMRIEIRENLLDVTGYERHKILFLAEENELKAAALAFEEEFKDAIHVEHAMPNFLDIMASGISKGTSLIEIADYYGIDHADTIAFGDGRNDITMIKTAAKGIAMANAIDDVKEVADEITLSNDEDGIAIYLENNILN